VQDESERRMIQELVARFVADELIPLEPMIIERELTTGRAELTPEERDALAEKAKALGLWALDMPEALGGMGLSPRTMIKVHEALAQSFVMFHFPPDSPNAVMLDAVATPEQKTRYLEPYVAGEMHSAICISEPGAGGDVSDMRARAAKDADGWVLNGRKIWISNAPEADFVIAMLRVGDGKRHEGITAFIVEKDAPGFRVERAIPMLGGYTTYEVVFEDCRVAADAVLGEVGKGFAPMQLRLVTRRLEMGAQCLGAARRALDILMEHARQRVTFGQPLSERQSVQWWVADAAIKLHALELMLEDAAAKVERGADVRNEAAMIKVFATENAYQIVDHAMQTLGAMGMAREVPLHMISSRIRLQRIYEGPTEVHMMAIARNLFRK
jgi:alkylation response protein AidB-like acyl-CoA dehydrogenase